MSLLRSDSFDPEAFGDLDVCIVGGGPTGLIIAESFLDSGHRVLVTECGTDEEAAETRALAAGVGESIGDTFPDARYVSTRQIGGMANKWRIDLTGEQPSQDAALTSHLATEEEYDRSGGPGRDGVRYAMLDDIDFEKRDWLPHSGWPITRADLMPYLERVHALGDAGPCDYDAGPAIDEDHQPLATDPHRIKTQLFRFQSGTLFLETFRDRIAASKTVDILLGATATELLTTEDGGRVTGVRLRNHRGLDTVVTARVVIVATGAIENARLLFNSNAARPAGLGNDHDQLGRYLMDHPVIRSGTIAVSSPDTIRGLALYDTQFIDGAMVICKPALAEAVRREEHLLGIHAAMFPRIGPPQRALIERLFPGGATFRSPGLAAARALKDALRKRRWPRNAVRLAFDLVRYAPDIAFLIHRRWHRPKHRYGFDCGGWSRLDDLSAYGHLEFVHMTEQAPHPENRVVPTEERDALGARKVQQFWKWRDIDRRSTRRALEIFREEFARAGLGDLVLELDHDVPRIAMPSAHHLMGTTRMSDDPREGVVDSTCRVHGVDNLFVAGSSVFPTGSYANPTLTLLALALRVADDAAALLERDRGRD